MRDTLTTVTFAVLDSIPACVYWKDTDLRFTGANKAFLAISGSSSLEDLKKKAVELYEKIFDPCF